MNVLEIEPGVQEYPEHDHLKDGQEEVYLVIKGSGTMHVGDKDLELKQGTFVHVGPKTKRKILAGAEGITILAIGGTPGQATHRSAATDHVKFLRNQRYPNSLGHRRGRKFVAASGDWEK